MSALIDGRRIAYDDSGGRGLPLVLLHGFPFDSTVWDDVVPMLSARGIRVVRIDLRGSGRSEPSEGPALMEALAGDVAGVLEALGIERAALVGHSIGGYVALSFFRMYAERVAGLALVASHVSADAPADSPDPVQRELAAGRPALADRAERDGSMDAVIASYLPRSFAPHVYQHDPALVERARAVMARQDPNGAAQLIRGMRQRVDAHDLLEDVAVPALILAGADDVYLTPESLRETAGAIVGAEFVVLDRVGHAPMLEAPEKTADALAAFAQRVHESSAGAA